MLYCGDQDGIMAFTDLTYITTNSFSYVYLIFRDSGGYFLDSRSLTVDNNSSGVLATSFCCCFFVRLFSIA